MTSVAPNPSSSPIEFVVVGSSSPAGQVGQQQFLAVRLPGPADGGQHAVSSPLGCQLVRRRGPEQRRISETCFCYTSEKTHIFDERRRDGLLPGDQVLALKRSIRLGSPSPSSQRC